MSLVNDMLNDLDARRAQQPKSEVNLDWLVGSRQKGRAKRSRLQWLPVIAALAGVMAVTVYYKPWQLITISEDVYPQPEKTRGALPVIPQYANSSEPKQKSSPVLSKPDKTADIETETQGVSAEPGPIISNEMARPSQDIYVAKADDKPATQEKTIESVNASPAISGNQQVTKKALPETEQNSVSNGERQETVAALPVIKKALPLTAERLDQKIAKEALNKMRVGATNEAMAMLQKQLHSKSDSIHSGKLLISLLLSQQRFVEADQLLQQIQAAFPKHIGLMVMKARMHLQSDEPAKALAYLQQQRPPLLEYPTYYEMQATAAQRSGDYQLARKTYASLLRVDGSRADWWFGLAVAFDAQAENNHALVAYQRALGQRGLTRTLQDYANRRVGELAGAG